MAKHKAGHQIYPGDKVRVSLGYEAVCTVLEVYGPRDSLSYYCSVPVHGVDGEILDEEFISFPGDAVTLVESAPRVAA
jgi:hypothetical protein